MSKRLIKVVALVLLGVLLLTLPGLVGCGEEEGGRNEIVVGVLADFTGPAASAMQPTIQALMAYLRMVEEENLLPGVKITGITYDTRLDYSRVVPGYEWLRGQGAVFMVVPSGPDCTILADKFEKDRIPVVGSQGSTTLMGRQWVFTTYSPIQSQAEVEMQWIMDTWDYEELGKPRLGHLGTDLMGTVFLQEGIDDMLEAHPGKFEWVGLEKAPLGTTAWAVEAMKLKDCDFILDCAVVGPMVTSFIREARMRGYEGGFISGMEAFPGFWDLIRGVVPAEDLYDCYYVGWWPWWNEDVPFINELKEYVQKYHPGDAEAWMRSSGPISGWTFGMLVYYGIEGAIEKVGAENVDGSAVRDALAEIDKPVEGWGNPWKISEQNNVISWGQKVFEWDTAQEEWVAVSGWMIPSSMPVD